MHEPLAGFIDNYSIESGYHYLHFGWYGKERLRATVLMPQVS